LHAHLHACRGGRGESEIRYEAVGIDVVAVHVVHEISLRIVLLLCTHGISLGRTKLHKQGKKKGRGQLAQLRVMLLEGRRIVVILQSRVWLGTRQEPLRCACIGHCSRRSSTLRRKGLLLLLLLRVRQRTSLLLLASRTQVILLSKGTSAATVEWESE